MHEWTTIRIPKMPDSFLLLRKKLVAIRHFEQKKKNNNNSSNMKMEKDLCFPLCLTYSSGYKFMQICFVYTSFVSPAAS